MVWGMAVQEWPDYPVYVFAISPHRWFLAYKEQCESGQRRRVIKTSDIGAVIACYNREDAEHLCKYLHDGTFGEIDLEIIEAPRAKRGAST